MEPLLQTPENIQNGHGRLKSLCNWCNKRLIVFTWLTSQRDDQLKITKRTQEDFAEVEKMEEK